MLQHISLNDVELAVDGSGAGAPLLLVHGFPLDHTMWRSQIEHFQRHWRVIAPDLRGFGRSGEASGTVTMRQMADDLAQLLDKLQVRDPVCFCGLSMGGYVAWEFAAAYPKRLGSLILCDTRAAADAPEARATRIATADRVLQEGPAFLADSMPIKLFAASTRESQPQLVQETRDVIRRAPRGGVAAASLGMAERSDFRERLGEFDLPALVLVGAEDSISPPAEMREIADGLPRAIYVEIPAAGHMAPLEQPAAVNAAIEHFLLSTQ